MLCFQEEDRDSGTESDEENAELQALEEGLYFLFVYSIGLVFSCIHDSKSSSWRDELLMTGLSPSRYSYYKT